MTDAQRLERARAEFARALCLLRLDPEGAARFRDLPRSALSDAADKVLARLRRLQGAADELWVALQHRNVRLSTDSDPRQVAEFARVLLNFRSCVSEEVLSDHPG